MEIKTEQIGKYLVVTASGRLDATWSEYFADVFLKYIRTGDHHLIVDAAAIGFLSSAGIRSLVRITKELNSVRGSFGIVHATDFVSKTLEATGFGSWLVDSLPADLQPLMQPKSVGGDFKQELYRLNSRRPLQFAVTDAWQKWGSIDPSKATVLTFSPDTFALGIGSTSMRTDESTSQFGEFIAVCGNLAYLAPEEKLRPDYLLSLNNFIPEILAVQALSIQGDMSHLFRFSPGDEKPAVTVSELAGQALAVSGSTVAAFVIIAETGGLVGANLIKSPGEIGAEPLGNTMTIRDWLSFSGEKVFGGEQSVIFGLVAQASEAENKPWLRQLPSKPGLFAHMHALVFPYQPLPNGNIDLKQQVDKFFSGPPPMALMHLIDDNRPVMGLGESSFIRGACWCAPLKGKEGLL